MTIRLVIVAAKTEMFHGTELPLGQKNGLANSLGPFPARGFSDPLNLMVSSDRSGLISL